MPGEKRLAKLDKGRARGFLIHPILKTLERRKKVETGMLVKGTGLDALKALYRIRVAGEVPSTPTENDEVSLLFFTYPVPWSVELDQVVKSKNAIDIRYRIIPSDGGISSHSFTLISLGRLSAGKYQVKIQQLDMAQKFVEMGYRPLPAEVLERTVCRPFQFLITEKGGNP